MKEHQIITIGRELGSGGREIAIKLSEELKIPFYDKEILDKAAQKSGYSKEIFERHDEKPTSSFLYALAMGGSAYGHLYQRPILLDLYLAQFETIRRLAGEGPGIFIGRCADYVLNNHEHILNVFVHADMQDRVKRTMKKHGIGEKQAKDMCVRSDKDRASYYNYYSDHQWGDGRHYDLCINTSKIGPERAVKLIIECL